MNSGDQDLTNREPATSNAAAYEQLIRLFAHHEGGLRAFVRSLLPSREHADEVIQETCVVLWRKFGDLHTNLTSGSGRMQKLCAKSLLGASWRCVRY